MAIPTLTLSVPNIISLEKDARLEVHNFTATGTAAYPVVFEQAKPGDRWDSIVFEGSNADSHYLHRVRIEGGTTGALVRAPNAVFDHVTLAGNSLGLITDYDYNFCGSGQSSSACSARSELILSNSAITGSVASATGSVSGHGLVLRNTVAEVTNTTVTANDGYGVIVWNASVWPFTGNTVTANGFPTTNAPSSEDGILVHANGDLKMSSKTVKGFNTVSGNSRNQIQVLSGGILFVGQDGGGYVSADNSITAGAGGSVLVRNNSGSLVKAENTWWGAASGPPAGAFAGAGLVDAVPFLTLDPSISARQSGGSDVFSEAVGGSMEAGREIDETLHAELLALRDSLSLAPEAPEAPGWVRALYLIQRLDLDDVLGEYGETVALLTELRQNLDDEASPPALRRTGEAALAAEVAEGLLREDYDEAEALLASYGNSGVEEDLLALTLSAVASHEQAGRYEAALALLAEAMVLAPEQAAELALVAAFVAESLEGSLQAGSGREAGSQTMRRASETAPTASSREGSLPRDYALQPAYPNPASGGATVPFALPEAADVRIVVYDLLGREVAVLAEGLHEAGRHEARFEASQLSAGVYVIRAQVVAAGGAVRAFTQKLTLVR